MFFFQYSLFDRLVQVKLVQLRLVYFRQVKVRLRLGYNYFQFNIFILGFSTRHRDVIGSRGGQDHPDRKRFRKPVFASRCGSEFARICGRRKTGNYHLSTGKVRLGQLPCLPRTFPDCRIPRSGIRFQAAQQVNSFFVL